MEMSENDIMQTYGSSDQRQSNLLDISNYSAHIKNRSFDLDLQREYRSPPQKMNPRSMFWITNFQAGSSYMNMEFYLKYCFQGLSDMNETKIPI